MAVKSRSAIKISITFGLPHGKKYISLDMAYYGGQVGNTLAWHAGNPGSSMGQGDT